MNQPSRTVKARERISHLQQQLFPRDYVTETARTIPVVARCQVLVVGGGVAGLSAAIAAKKTRQVAGTGVDVILLEKENPNKKLKLEKQDSILEKHGIRTLFQCLAVETIVRDHQIEAVIIESTVGRQAILANRIIDCTGNGDIAFLSHCHYTQLDTFYPTAVGRSIVGLQTLTRQDVLNGVTFPNSIGVLPQSLVADNKNEYKNENKNKNKMFYLPLGCLLPTSINNLVVAGKAISGDSFISNMMRDPMACRVSGQAAGVVAAVSLLENKTTYQTEIHLIQIELRRQGVRFD